MIYRFISEHGPYNRELFNTPKNGFLNKPSGGLWTAPATSSCDDYHSPWHEFMCNDMGRRGPFYCTDIRLAPGARVLDYKNMDKYMDDKYSNKYLSIAAVTIDFEAIAKDYDAVLYTGGYSYGVFYGWDVDTCLILNPDVIQVVRVFKI